MVTVPAVVSLSPARTARPAEPASRRTKIVCTLGPASATASRIQSLLAAGANVFRLNFSHSDHDWHSRVLQTVRTVAADLDLPIAVMQDLCGPKIRVGQLARPVLEAAEGDRLQITTERHLAGKRGLGSCDISSTYGALLDDVTVGSRILIDDGRVELEVVEIQSSHLVGLVVRGGRIGPGKGMNLPGIALSTECLTKKDWADLDWGISHDVDLIALSFVRHPDDLLAVRNRMDEAGCRAKLIAKIERPEAIEHIEPIVALADGLMVARGDLGLETELPRVPLLQKRLIERCRYANKPVITATQMLESMVQDATPTRAEVSDVANAIYDGTDAIMLSAETATGRFPRLATEMLHRVAQVTEADLANRPRSIGRQGAIDSAPAAIAEAAAVAALELGARGVVVYSQTGATARLMAQYRLPMPVIAVTNIQTTYRQLALSYGVNPVYMPEIVSLAQLLEKIDQTIPERNWGASGDTLVVVSALDGRDGHIDTLHVHTVRC